MKLPRLGTGLANAAALNRAMNTNIPRLAPQVQAWTSSTLDAVVWADILGGNVMPVTRAAGMAVPALARARHLTCGAIARLPLQALRGDAPVDPLPYWCQGTDGQLGKLTGADLDQTGIEPQSPFHRMLSTVDDHLFHGEALWGVTEWSDPDLPISTGGDDPRPVYPNPDGPPVHPVRLVRVPRDNWDRVYVEDTHTWTFTDAGSNPLAFPVVYLPGPHEGVLNFAQTTIRSASALELSAADTASRPFRLELHQTTDIELTKQERGELISATRAALADNNGVLFTNAAIETKDHPMDAASDLLIAGRNASALDVARIVSMPAAMLDAVQVGASLTYETTQGRNQEWIDYGLQLYVDAVQSRLSMDDVVPQGVRVAFDLSSLTTPAAPATGPATED